MHAFESRIYKNETISTLPPGRHGVEVRLGRDLTVKLVYGETGKVQGRPRTLYVQSEPWKGFSLKILYYENFSKYLKKLENAIDTITPFS